MKPKTWQERLRKRFEYNIDRVSNLLKAAEPMADNNCGQDILRASVVLLHATLEDVLRTLQSRKLPTASDELLSVVPIERKADDKKVMTYSLGMLRRLRRESIDEFISERVREYYNRQTYNDAADLVKAATMIGAEPEKAGRLANRLKALIKRRHHIVHQSDRDELNDETHGKLIGIDADDVAPWIKAVQAFVELMLEAGDSFPELHSSATE